jgi:hypothetical protein
MSRLSVLGFVILILGCGPRGPVAEPEPGPEPPPVEVPVEPEPVADSPHRGFSTIEELGKAFVQAVNQGNHDAIRSFFPPDELVLSSVQCPGPHPVLEEIHEDREGFIAELASLAGVQLEWVGLVPRKEEVTEIAVGEDLMGCTATKAITVKEVLGNYLLTEGGQTTEQTQEVAVGRFGSDGLWYVLKL